MNILPILTIAIPTFNMGRWLKKNLETYVDGRLNGKLEVIVLNNASEDTSQQIAESFCEQQPEIFQLVNRDSRGYGSSINAAIKLARGTYFRIIDADDWVDTEELVKLTLALEGCEVDVVLTDYQIVNMQTGENISVHAADAGARYGEVLENFSICAHMQPSLHAVTYRTELLRESGFYMQDEMFFVDEEYVILPFLYAQSVICMPFSVYRYQVANPEQSTSPQNRAKYQAHREAVLRRLIRVYLVEKENMGRTEDAMAYCHTRISKGVGDHYTTLYMYMADRAEGRQLAHTWRLWLMGLPDRSFYEETKRKSEILCLLNRLHISLKAYSFLKKIKNVGGKRG